MAQATRTFRIFVSSTFHDLKEERNALQKMVFPRLRELCMQHGARFQAIDLRWGVSEQASLDQQAMNICLGEIGRCQKTTPRPNFIVLLGDRYGWRPLPSEIPADEFEEIERRVSDDGHKALLSSWYKRDDNAVPPQYCLQPRTGEFEDYEVWDQQVERPLHNILAQATEGMSLAAEQRLKYVSSATHQEIVRGALQVEDAPDHVFCFFRKIEDLPQDEKAKGFLDLDEEGNPDGEAHQQLKQLKAELGQLLPGNVHEYDAKWTRSGVTTEHLEQLCEDVYKCLSQVILEEVGAFILQEVQPPEEIDPLELEIVEHRKFGMDRAKFFVGREEILETIADYVRSADPHPLAVWGKSGSGKSALMAKAVQQAVKMHPEAEVIYRFIGATPESSNGRALLESLCRQISRRYGEDESSVAADYRELAEDFPKRLALATAEKPLILFLDALDQLSDADNVRNLAWLPADLPEHVRLVVSTLPGECRSVLKGKLRPENLVELKPMPPEQGSELLDLWLQDASRSLQAHQRGEVLGKFNEEGNGLPLYLKLAFEEARRWKSYTDPKETALGADVPGVIRDLFARLSAEGNHGEMLVSRSLGYLAAAKNGLTEDELLDVLSRDVELYAWFLESLYHTPPDLLECVQEHLEHTRASRPGEERLSPIDEQAAEEWLKGLRTDSARLLEFLSAVVTKSDGLRLPVVLWSRLYFDLEPYLALRSGDGTALLSFYHRQLAEVTGEQYLSGEERPKRHQTLARYFEVQPLYAEGDEGRAPNLRKLSEQPYQETYGELWDEIEETLSDLCFIEAKCAAGMTYDLIRDYSAALDALPEAQEEREREQKHDERVEKYAEDLVAYARGEIDSLDVIPSVEVWSNERIEEDTERIISNPARLDRMRAFSQFANSESHALVKFASVRGFCLQEAYNSARSGPVASAAETIVNTEVDDVLLLRSPAQRPGYNPHPALLRTLEGHTGQVTSVSITPGGKRAVSGSEDHTLRVWDLESGECLRTLEGHTGNVLSVSVTPDGENAVSGSMDHTLRVWDLESGACLRTLEGHTGNVFSVSVTPGGRRAVSGSWDQTLRLWDLERGECLRTIEGYTCGVVSVSITPDGQRAIAGSDDNTPRVWDLESGQCLGTLEGHTGNVLGVSVTPDGKRAVSGSMDHTLRVWDVESGGRPGTLEGHTDPVYGVSITPDGKRAVSGGEDHSLRVWDLESGACLRTLEGHTGNVFGVSITPDGKRAVSGAFDHTVRVWDLERGRRLTSVNGHTGSVKRVTITPDGSRAISASEDHTLRVWDLENGECLGPLEGHWDAIYGVSITPDGKRAISASWDHTLWVWDLETGECLRTLEGHTHHVFSASVTPDGKRAISVSADNTLRVWDLESGECVGTLEGHTNPVYCVSVTLDGRTAVSGGADHTVRVWDIESGQCLGRFEGHTDWVVSVRVTPDGKRAVSGSADNTLRVWDLESGVCLGTLEGHTDVVWSVSPTPDGKRAVSASEDHTLRVWDIESGQCLGTLEGHTGNVLGVSVAPDGRRAVSGGEDKILRVWHLESGESIATYQAGSGVVSVSDIRPGGSFVCGTRTGEVTVITSRNFPMEPPVATPHRIWQYGGHGKNGYCEDDVTALCHWCGQRFPVGDEILDLIAAITHDANLSPDQSPCIELPTEAWDEPRLLSECPHCHRPLRFSPFIVSCRETVAVDPLEVEITEQESFGEDRAKFFIGREQMLETMMKHVKPKVAEEGVLVDVDDLLRRGANLLESGESERALECFNEAIKARPDDLTLLSYRAAALLRLGRNQEALETIDHILDRQLASGQDLVHIYSGKAKALVGLERYEEALTYYQKALEIAAGDNNLWFMQGYAFYQLDEFDQALTSFVKARELKDELRTSLHIGYCLLMLKRFSEAAGEFSSLISECSPDPQAFYGLGLAKYALGEKREARMHLERFIKMAGPEHEHLLPQARRILQQV